MPRTPTTDLELLAQLRHDPPRLGEMASAASALDFQMQVEVRGATESPTDVWPQPTSLRAGQCLALQIEASDEGASAWLAWLDQLAAAPIANTPRGAPLRLAPCTSEPAGTFRLWAMAVARLRLPPTIRVEARHDLIGIRLAQIALRFGADALAGPIDQDRHLPVAGVTRPNENTRAGLFSLIEQAGRRPVDAPGVAQAAELTTTPVLPPKGMAKRIQV